MGFSDNLYHLRAARNMTQEQLAMLMGVSRQAISKWESGRAYPEMDKLVRLCGIFDCDLNDLVRGDVTERAARADLTVPDGAAPADICGYDRTMRACALMLSGAIAVPMLALAVFFGTSGTVAYRDDAAGGVVFAPLVPLMRDSPFGLAALVAGLLAGLALAAVAANRYLGFRGRFPYVEDFYADGQREQARALARRARIVAALTGAVAVIACVVKAGPLYHLSGGLASLFGWGGVALWSLAYAGLMGERLKVDRYNERNAAALDRRDAARACALQPAAGSFMRENPEVPRLARTWVRRQATIGAAAVLAGFGLVAGAFALLGWCIWFIPVVVGAVAAALVRLYAPLVR